jgi:hypothetical protein
VIHQGGDIGAAQALTGQLLASLDLLKGYFTSEVEPRAGPGRGVDHPALCNRFLTVPKETSNPSAVSTLAMSRSDRPSAAIARIRAIAACSVGISSSR